MLPAPGNLPDVLNVFLDALDLLAIYHRKGP